MDDLISRQAAIDALCNDYCGGHQDCKYYPNCENLKSIEQLPYAQPELRWIPCSERMPKVGQNILMSVGGMYTAEGCLREDGDWAQFRWDTIQRKERGENPTPKSKAECERELIEEFSDMSSCR